jgi:subtilisin family serine protease
MALNVRYGGKESKPYRLETSKDMMVVRSANYRLPVHIELTPKTRAAMDRLTPVMSVARAGVQLFEDPTGGRAVSRARTLLDKEREVRFAGAALKDPASGAPVIYSENAFVKFHEGANESRRAKLLKKYKLSIKRALAYGGNEGNALFVGAPEGIGREIFAVTSSLLDEDEVELCHPELLRKISFRQAFPQQWHLKKTTIKSKLINAHANVEAAWAVTRGDGITIAVIDDGFDLNHEEFQSADKIVSPWDATRKTNDPSPGTGDMHGHSCAGVACANGLHGASGVAPGAKLMPIRLASALGSQDEADAFVWAADHGADVISCSWGPADGDWWDPTDPVHKEVVPLPDSTRLAIDHALNNGRGGKGCVILWAAGNGNESVDNDGYAANPNIVAVAACNDRSKRSAYSDKGGAVWCAFPSNDGNPSLTPGIWTTDLSGAAGYNDGNIKKGDVAGNYTNSFGGTSSAAPGAAGVAALVLSKNPGLGWQQVKDVLKRCCDRIDKTGGKYDKKGHSASYGYGRLNAKKAVDLA